MTTALRRLALALGLTLSLALTGCSAVEQVSEGLSTVDAAVEYTEALTALQATEQDLINRYDSVTGANYTDDVTLYEELLTLVPDVQAFITDLEAIPTGTPEIAQLHEILIEAWNEQARGMTLSISALEQQDFDKVAEANDALSKGRSLLRNYLIQADEILGLGN